MSLLLDARKKSQQAQAGEGNTSSGLELSLEPNPDTAATQETPASVDTAIAEEQARLAGQNLFNAKSGSAQSVRPGFNRNLLIALLVGAVILLAAGGGYVWYEISPTKARPRPVKIASTPQHKPAPVPLPAKSDLVPGIVSAKSVPPKPAKTRSSRRAATHRASTTPRATNPVHIVQNVESPIDPLLNNAYLAYRAGKLDQAQQLYLKVLSLDSNNTDALLGMAVIAQHRGEDNVAAHYYTQVLTLDPRNAVANAGMSSLSNNDDSESRLKMLLNEQQNSSSLHFALGNYYAEHARWAEAQRAYFDAYKLAPDRAELAFNLAVSLDRLGQNKPAAQYYRRALQLDPGQLANFDHAKVSQRIEELAH